MMIINKNIKSTAIINQFLSLEDKFKCINILDQNYSFPAILNYLIKISLVLFENSFVP